MLDTSYGVSCDVRSQHLFVYGSLCAPEVMAAVTGLRMRAVIARLANHRVLALRGEVYPGLTCAEGHQADGRLYRAVPDWALRHLDTFEGPWYERVPVHVQLAGAADERELRAHAYRLHPSALSRACATGWARDAFMQTQCRRFAQVWRDRRRRRRRRHGRELARV